MPPMMGPEGAGIGEDAEEQDGEDEHDAGGGHRADAVRAGASCCPGSEVGQEVHRAGPASAMKKQAMMPVTKGTAMRATAGDAFFVMMSTIMTMTVTKPKTARNMDVANNASSFFSFF